MNLGPNTVSSTYQYVLNQSGNSAITLGNNSAVNWGAAGVVMTTGNQTISGNKVFQGSTTIGSSQVYSNNFGGGALTNSLGANATTNSLGANATTNFFGTSAITNSFGNDASTNSFGNEASSNYFGDRAANFFGASASTNSFGSFASNSFGVGASNSFGSFASNSFGSFASTNSFGASSNNVYYSGRFQGPIRVELSQFSGLSSQAGQRGELRVSGNYLYVCTGSSAGWNRIELETF